MRLLSRLQDYLRCWIARVGLLRMFNTPFSANTLSYDLSLLQTNASNIQIDGSLIRVAKAPATWSFLAHINPKRRLPDERSTSPAAIDVTLEVTAGTIGIMVLKKGTHDGSIDETLVSAKDGLISVRLFVPNLSMVGQLVIRNAGEAGGPIALRICKIKLTPLSIQLAVDSTDVLHAFYDLTNYPGTFDFGYFLMAAEVTRQKVGLNALQIYIVRPGRDAEQRLPSGFSAAVDEGARDWRILNILLPMLTFLPSVVGYSLLPDRVAAAALREHLTNVYPEHLHREAVPIYLAYQEVNRELAQTPSALRLRASVEGLRLIQQWISTRARGRKLITITLRQYDFLSERNSNVEAWTTFARELTRDGYFPVIVPDTATALDSLSPELAGITVIPEAALNLLLRMALYESAYLNLATTGGPIALMLLSDRCKFLLLKLLVPGVPLCSAEHLTQIGFVIGKDPPYLGIGQHIVWESDDLPIIRREFYAMITRLERAAEPVLLDRK